MFHWSSLLTFYLEKNIEWTNPFFKDYMYICMQHLNASLLWLVSVLGPVLCRFYSFVVAVCFVMFLIFFKCIYVDVCLWNVNQYYKKKSFLTSRAQVLLDQSNKASWVFPALESTNHFLPQSAMSCRSDSSSVPYSSCCHRSDTWSHL